MHPSRHASDTRPASAGRVRCVEAGFSLIEALTASVIAIIAIVGLAYTFGIGRGMVNRYEIARAALGQVQSRVELLSVLPASSESLNVGYASPLLPFDYEGSHRGDLWWHIAAYNPPGIPGTTNLRRATVCVRWQTGSLSDSVMLDRLFSLQ